MNDRPTQRVTAGFAAWFVFCGLCAAGWIAFLVWAIYTLVNWVVAQ